MLQFHFMKMYVVVYFDNRRDFRLHELTITPFSIIPPIYPTGIASAQWQPCKLDIPLTANGVSHQAANWFNPTTVKANSFVMSLETHHK